MELIALKRAFYDNGLLEAGDRFEFHGTKVPSWAAEPEKAAVALAQEKTKPINGDTKPKAAQAAVRRKAAS